MWIPNWGDGINIELKNMAGINNFGIKQIIIDNNSRSENIRIFSLFKREAPPGSLSPPLYLHAMPQWPSLNSIIIFAMFNYFQPS